MLLLTGRFVYVWAPIQKGVPARDALAAGVGAVLLLCAAGLLWRKSAVIPAGVVGLIFLAWLLLLQAPRIVAAPSKELLWSGAAQLAAVVAASAIVFQSAGNDLRSARWRIRAPRLLYAISLLVFGLHHFLSMPGAVEAVPAWIPAPAGWVYLTGIAHIAAGMALLIGIVPGLAATLEASMISAFVLLVHVPGVVAAPRDRLQWTMLSVAFLIAAAAWVVAQSSSDFERHPEARA
ncbi:MAG TPA: hypothetical protein VGH20_15940 [Myxococcales bacterium]